MQPIENTTLYRHLHATYPYLTPRALTSAYYELTYAADTPRTTPANLHHLTTEACADADACDTYVQAHLTDPTIAALVTDDPTLGGRGAPREAVLDAVGLTAVLNHLLTSDELYGRVVERLAAVGESVACEHSEHIEFPRPR